MRASTAVFAFVLPALIPACVQAEGRVELEVIMESRFPTTPPQRWAAMLDQAGFSNIRIRSARPGETGGVEKRGTDQSPVYHVTAVLTDRDQLQVPGATFRITDRGLISNWVEKLEGDGVEGLTAKTGAFGLTSQQLVDLHRSLATPIAIQTQGRRCGEVATEIASSLAVDVVWEPAARNALTSEELVAEEMTGMSAGTSLAAALRPLGLVAVPHRPTGGAVQLTIKDARNANEIWPVGWPNEKSLLETIPDMFKFLTVEIENFKLSDAISAIQRRLEIPFLYDRNAIVRHGVDPREIMVSLPKGRSYYKKIIDRMLAQTRPQLKSEIRVDEAGQPFLWITTVKP